MRKHGDEMNQVLEQIQNGFVRRTVPGGHDFTVRMIPPDQILAAHQWLNNDDAMTLQQVSNFDTECRKRCLLDFKKASANDGVDAIAINLDFDIVGRTGVKALQLTV